MAASSFQLNSENWSEPISSQTLARVWRGGFVSFGPLSELDGKEKKILLEKAYFASFSARYLRTSSRNIFFPMSLRNQGRRLTKRLRNGWTTNVARLLRCWFPRCQSRGELR